LTGWAWVLIGILIQPNGDLQVGKAGVFEKMYHCFEAREIMITNLGGVGGRPPPNTQFVCILAKLDDNPT